MRRSPRSLTTSFIPRRISISCSPSLPLSRSSSLPITALSSAVVTSTNRAISPSPSRWNNPGLCLPPLPLGEGWGEGLWSNLRSTSGMRTGSAEWLDGARVTVAPWPSTHYDAVRLIGEALHPQAVVVRPRHVCSAREGRCAHRHGSHLSTLTADRRGLYASSASGVGRQCVCTRIPGVVDRARSRGQVPHRHAWPKRSTPQGGLRGAS